MRLFQPLLLLFSVWEAYGNSSPRSLFCSSNWRNKEEWSYSDRRDFGGGQGSIGLIGDVNDVLQGIVPREARDSVYDLVSMGRPVGLGAGAVGDSLKGLGEALLVNGLAFVRTTDNGSADYFQTVSSTKYRSTFTVLLLEGCTADGVVNFNSEAGEMSLTDFYSRVNTATGGVPFCFAGFVEYANLEGIAVSKAPIYQEPLFGNIREGYYSQPAFQLRDQYSFTAGCVGNFSAVSNDAELSRKLRKLLYLNPLDTMVSQSLETHSHALTLNKCARSQSEILPGSVEGAFHMLSSATLRSVHAQVYLLDRSDRLVEMGSGPQQPQPPSKDSSSGYSSTSPILSVLIIPTLIYLSILVKHLTTE